MLVGRVLNQASGNFLTNAKVLIEGTNLEALTTDTGEFQFTHLPAGELRIVASFTGFKSVAKMVTVAPGSVVREDFELNLIMLTKRCTIYADVRNFLGVPYMWGTWSPDTPEYARVDNSYYSSSTFSMGVKGSF